MVAWSSSTPTGTICFCGACTKNDRGAVDYYRYFSGLEVDRVVGALLWLFRASLVLLGLNDFLDSMETITMRNVPREWMPGFADKRPWPFPFLVLSENLLGFLECHKDLDAGKSATLCQSNRCR